MDEFIKALSMIEVIIPEPLEYRMHYNEFGDIYMCTMQQHPTDTQYVVVSKDEYDNYFRYHVVNGVLKLIDKPTGDRVQLKRSSQGYAVVKGHAGILLENSETYHNIEYYEATS